MKRILLLLLLLSVSANASQLTVRQDALLYLGKITTGIKLTGLGMLASNVFQLEHRKIDDLVAIVANSFDESYGEFIKVAENTRGLSDKLTFAKKTQNLISLLASPKNIPESIILARMAILPLRSLFSEQSFMENEHATRGLQTIAEMEKIIGVEGEMVYLDEVQMDQWDQLVNQLVEIFVLVVKDIFPMDFVQYSQSLIERIFDDLSDNVDLDTALSYQTLIETYQAIDEFFYLIEVGLLDLPLEMRERINQQLGQEVAEVIRAATSIESRHLELSFNYYDGSISSNEFIRQYRQFLHEHVEYFSTKQLQKAEQKLQLLVD